MNTILRPFPLVALLASLTLTTTHAQERLSTEEARHYASIVSAAQPELKRAPGAAPVDLDKPVALRDGEYGLMLLPARTLSADAVAKAGAEGVPVGQLWLLKLAPLTAGQVVSQDRLQMVTVNSSEGSVTLPCCQLGIRKATGGALELVVFGKGKEPVATAPLQPLVASQTLPLDLAVAREDDRGELTLKIAGKYTARLAVTDPELY